MVTLKWALVFDKIPSLLHGCAVTMEISVLTLIFGTILGVILALMRDSHIKVIARLAQLYIWIWRGTPLMVQAFLIYFGLPNLFHIPYSDEVLSLYQRITLSYWKAYERGEITPAALAIARFRDFLAAVGKDGDPALMCQLYQTSLGEDCTPIHDALRVCRILYERGYKLSIITNGRSTTQHSRLSHSELTPMILDLFISEELGCQNPKKNFSMLYFQSFKFLLLRLLSLVTL